MSGGSGTPSGAAALPGRAGPGRRVLLASAAVVILVAAMALDTKVVRLGSPAAAPAGAFSAAAYGSTEFPKVRAAIAARAVDAATLAAAIAKDPAVAAKQYGVDAGGSPEFAVNFTGIAGQGDSGVYDVTVPGMPSNVAIHVQTGPAIMGTDLRDATGTIQFGQFTNQIDYQNAGSAINKEMKQQVLSKIDTGNLAGKTVKVTGAFQLTDPDSWTVTPVQMDVQ